MVNEQSPTHKQADAILDAFQATSKRKHGADKVITTEDSRTQQMLQGLFLLWKNSKRTGVRQSVHASSGESSHCFAQTTFRLSSVIPVRARTGLEHSVYEHSAQIC